MRVCAFSRIFVLGVTLLAGCSTTDVVQIDLRNVKLMVVGLAAVSENRIKFEDVLSKKLLDANIETIASHTLIPTLDAQSRESITRVARESGVTSVIVVAPVRVEEGGSIASLGRGAGQHPQLAAFVEWGLGTKTLSTGQVAFVTNVYQLSSGRLLWGGVSWPFDLTDVDAVIEETASVIAGNVISAQRQLLRLNARGIDPLG